MFRIPPFLEWILKVFLRRRASKSSQTPYTNDVESWRCLWHHFGHHFGSILAPFEVHFGWKKQIFCPWRPQNWFLSIFTDFGPHLGGFWAPDRLEDLKKCICWHFFAFIFAFGRLSTHICIYFQQCSRNVRFYTCLRIFAHICSNCFKKSIMRTSPPRCHPQGHNARGTLQSLFCVVGPKPKPIPRIFHSCKLSGLRVARRG